MNALEHLKKVMDETGTMYDDIAAVFPNIVHCKDCGREENVDPAHCLKHGWPTCCDGLTMYLGRKET